MDPLPFSTIRDYRNKAIELNPTYADLSINDFSDLFNRATGSQAFDAGLGSGFENAVKSYSAGADDLLEKYASPVQDALGEAGAKLFGAFERFGANPEVGRQVGKESLRSVVDFAPVIAGTALSFVPGLQAAGPVGLAATAALTGANAYEKSDSLAQTALAAGMVFAGGPLTRAGGSAALGAVRGAAAKSPVLKALGIEGGSLVAGKHILADGSEIAVERLIAQKVGDRVLGLVAGETAINATSMLGSSAVELFETGEMSNPFTADNILSNLVDPTLIFGVEELIRPTALMTRRIEENKANNDIVNASTEEAAKRVAQVTPTPVGTTLAELVNKRSEALARIESLPEDQRKEARVAVEELYAKAIGDEASLDRADAGELFGRSIEQALSDEKTKPLSEPVMMEDGSVGQKPITLEEVLDAEWARSGLTIDVARATGLSDDALLKLIEAEDRPRTREEYVQQIDKLNVVREEMGEELIDNEKLKSIVEDEVAKGSSLEDAVEAANEIVTTETQNKVARKGRIDYVKLFSKGEGAEYQAGLAAAKEFEKSGLDLETTLDQLEAAGRIPGELGSDERTNFKRGLREYSLKMAALKEERKIKAARAGKRGGRPKLDAVLPEDMPVLEVEGQLRELAKGKGPEADLAKNEIAVYDEALATIMKGNPRDRAQVYMAATLKKYLDKKAKGTLTDKGGTVAATPDQYVEILKRMLSPKVKDSQVSSVKWENVRKAKDSPLNMQFPTWDDADLGAKLLAQDHPDKEFKPLASGSGFKIVWKQTDVKMAKEQSVAEVLYWDSKGDTKTVDEKQGVESRNEALEDKLREMYGEDEDTLNKLLDWAREDPKQAQDHIDKWLETEAELSKGFKDELEDTDVYDYEELDDSFVNYDPVTGEELDDGLGSPEFVTPERRQKRIKEYTRVFGNTAREAMSAVAGPKDYVSDLARVVMDNFGKLTGRKLEDVKIEYTTNTRSFADSRRISFGTGNVDTPDLTDRQIMLHEFMHIASVGAIDKVGDPNVSSKLSGKEHTQYWLDRVKDLPEGDAVRDLVILWNHARKASGIHPSMSGELAIGDYHARRAHGSNPENKIDFDVAYGLMSPHEFLAQAFSSDKMKQFLDVVTVPDGMRTDATVPKTSIFNAIVNAIAKLFGIDRNDARLSTALTETLNVGIRMSQESVAGTRRSTERSAPEYVSPKDVTERILIKSGMKLDAVEAAHPVMEKLYNTFGASNDIEVGIMLDDARGAATITGLARRLYLGDKGLHEVDDATKIKALAFTAGHEMSHLTEQLFNNGLLTRKQHDKFSKFEEWTRKADANERKLALEIMSENLPKNLKDSDFIKVAMSSTNKPEEVRANLMAMWAMTQLEAPDQMAVNLLPREVLKGMNVLTDMARRVYGAMKGTTYALPKYMQDRPVRERIDNMVKFMEGLKDAHNKSEDFYTEGRNLLRVGPESRDIAGALRMFDGPDGPELNVPNDKRGVGRRLFDKWITQTDQLARMVPSFGPIIADLHNFVGDTKAVTKRTVGNITGELDDGGTPVFQSRTDKLRYEMVRDDAKLNKLASDWMRLMNETKNDLNGRGKFIELADLSAADKDLADRFGSITSKEREAIDQVVKRYADAMKHHNGEALRIITKESEASIQAYISSKRPDLWNDSAGIAKLLHDSVRAFGTQADVAGVAMAKENFAKVASLLSPIELQNAMKLSQAGIDAQAKMSDMFMRSPVFFSEIRVGKYFLHYKTPNGKTGGEAFDDMKDLRRRSEQLDKQGYSSFNVEEGRKGQPHMVNDKLLNFIAEHDEFNKKLIDDLDLSDEQKDNIKAHFTYAAELKRTLAAQEVVKVGSQRKMKPGRETLDMLSTQIAYFNASSRAMNRRVLQYRLSYHFANPEFKNELVSAHVPELKQQIENFFVPDTELGTQIAVANASYFLGMNMSSMLVEGAQPLFSYIPEMQSMGMSYVQAMKTVTKAQAQVAKYTLRNIPSAIAHKARKNSGVRKTEKMEFWDDPEHIELMNYAAQNDWISLTHANDVVEPDMSSNQDLSGIVGRKGEKQQSALSKYGITPVKHFARMSLKVYQQSTEFNARVALLSGYEIARKNGMDPKAAREEAGKFARTVTFSGGKLNRPNALFSGAGPVPRTVGQALYSLNGYTFGMLSMMRRYAETAFSKEQYPGITEADRKNARKALTTMVSTQFLGAGALGMPFVAAGIKLLEQITGQELEREAREGLAELFNEDEREDGGLLSDIVMHGAANALAGKVLPGAPDIGSRFAIGGVMGVNSYDGYSLSALVGPTGSVVENVVNGVTNAAQGNGAEAFQDIVPVAWKKVLEMMKHDGEFVTPSGELLAEGTKGEKLAYSMGFAPQRIRKMKNYERLQRQHEEVVRQRDIRTHDELAEMFSEDPVRARQELDKIVKDSPRVQEALKLGDPEMIQRAFESQIQDSATKIAERIERRTHARDPRRAGTFNSMSGEQTLLAAMGQTGAPSEVARLQTRATVQAQLGVQPLMSERAMSRAQIIDQIMARSPATPKAQAAAIADQILAGS